jgi:hypothetical protein
MPSTYGGIMNSAALEEMFLSVCGDWFDSHRGFEVRGELGVFSNAAVVWLGVSQRYSGGSLQSGVSELVSRVEEGTIESLVSRLGSKLREGNVSLNTGGLSRAKDRMPLESVSELFECATKKMFKSLGLTPSTRPVYVIDGQVVAIARTKKNLEHFGKTGNGEGELHFPRIRAVSVHELRSGIARQVAIGTWRDHEVTLAREVFAALPKGSIVIMDRGFDKPSFIRFARENEIKVIARLKNAFGAKLFANDKLAEGETAVEWNAKIKEGRIIERGRVVKYTSSVKGYRSSEFYFFTTADELSVQEVADYYRQRVRVETFIRDIKQTLKMSFVRSKKPENIQKEILIAYLTFNLIRAVMEDSAQKLDIAPERLSFTATIRLLQVYAKSIASAKNSKEREEVADRFRTKLYQAKLPNRSKDRNYPRCIKYPKDRYKTAGVVRKSLTEGR